MAHLGSDLRVVGKALPFFETARRRACLDERLRAAVANPLMCDGREM